MRHLETVLSCAKENGKKTYFTVIFERGADLSPELCQIADDTLREVHKEITAVDAARDKRIVALQAQNKSGDVSLDDGMGGDEGANDGVDDINPDDIMSIDPKQYRPGFLKKALERADALPRRGLPAACAPNRLKGWEKHYCSGECMQRAKMCGIYGNEGAASS